MKDPDDIKSWFNISNNLKKIYTNLDNDQISLRNKDIIQNITINSNFFIGIIFHTLIYNGILTYYKYHHFLNNGIMFLLVQLVRENLQCHHFFLYMLLKY